MVKRHKILSILPALLIMVIIFYFSHQEASESSQLSGGLVVRLLSIVERIFGVTLPLDESVYWHEILETVIRKAAHMLEYFVLAVAISYAFYTYNKREIALILWSEVITVLYAVTDEVHQLFIPGRSGQITDVLIDGFGGIVGCYLYYVLIRRQSRKRLK